MPESINRADALRVLDLPADATSAQAKRAYRRLARTHHPDRGGNTETFHQLRLAYECLAVEPAPPRPTPARGRPSRPFAVPDTPGLADIDRIDWSAAPARVSAPLSRDAVAVWLAGGTTTAASRLVTPLVASSRAPGSHLNRLASHMAGELTSCLTIASDQDDRGRATVAIDLRTSIRKARRAMDQVPLDGWVRRRGADWTRLRTTLPPSVDPRETAVRTLDRLEPMLRALHWPLEAWVATRAAQR